ncbi:MAG: phosphoethanolamine transferase domain-containing protein [Burkholderiaceae bacterium]
MSLKLFRSTEFAQSRSFSPQVQRRAVHPVWLLVAAGFWIAVPGNWALWSALARTPGFEPGAAMWIGVRIALLIAVASTALLCLLMWRWTTKLAVSLALIATALAGLPEPVVSPPLYWQSVLYVLIVAVLPCVWLWRTPLQRLSLGRNVRVIVWACVTCALLFALLLVFSVKNLAALHDRAPTLRAMVSPYGGSSAVAALEKVLLRRQP